jgi:hypothetical protein
MGMCWSGISTKWCHSRTRWSTSVGWSEIIVSILDHEDTNCSPAGFPPALSDARVKSFAARLHASGAALAVTAYQIGKLFLMGASVADRLSITERTLQACLGVTAAGSGRYFASLNNIIQRVSNVVITGQSLESQDEVFCRKPPSIRDV